MNPKRVYKGSYSHIGLRSIRGYRAPTYKAHLVPRVKGILPGEGSAAQHPKPLKAQSLQR